MAGMIVVLLVLSCCRELDVLSSIPVLFPWLFLQVFAPNFAGVVWAGVGVGGGGVSQTLNIIFCSCN